MIDANLVTKPRAEKLLKEADELTAIFTISVKTAKGERKSDDFRFQK